MKTRIVVILSLLAAVVGGAALVAHNRVLIGEWIVVPVERQPFAVTVSAPGKLQAGESVRVSCPVSWKPIVWLVPEGARVKKGDLIVKFDKTEIEDSVRSERAALRIAEARLDEAKARLEFERQKVLSNIESNKAALEIARLELADLRARPRADELQRAETEHRIATAVLEATREEYEITRRILEEQGDLAAIDPDDIRKNELEYRRALADFEGATVKLGVVREGPDRETVRQAELRLRQARLDLDQALGALSGKTDQLEAVVQRSRADLDKSRNRLEQEFRELADADLHSPADGMVAYLTVYNNKIDKGMKVFKGASIIDLPDVSRMTLQARVRESRIGLVSIGQKVVVHVDALPDESLPGTVVEVGQIAKDSSEMDLIGFGQEREDTGVKVFDVVVSIDAEHRLLKPNMAGRAEIVVWQDDEALVVPRDVLRQDDRGRFVHVMEGGRPERRDIVVGREDSDRAQILEGLEEGERVALRAPEA